MFRSALLTTTGKRILPICLRRSPTFSFSQWTQRGHDLTFESLTFGTRPKLMLQGYANTGFDVFNSIKKMDEQETAESGTLHLCGSILAFPNGCFLWNVETADDVNVESLSPILLHRPKLEYLFIGCNQFIPKENMDRIRLYFRDQNIVAEKLDLGSAMGTFNILNAEDRQVAVALVVDKTE